MIEPKSELAKALWATMVEKATNLGFDVRSRQINILAMTVFEALDTLQDQNLACMTAIASAAADHHEREKLLVRLIERVEALEAQNAKH